MTEVKFIPKKDAQYLFQGQFEKVATVAGKVFKDGDEDIFMIVDDDWDDLCICSLTRNECFSFRHAAEHIIFPVVEINACIEIKEL